MDGTITTSAGRPLIGLERTSGFRRGDLPWPQGVGTVYLPPPWELPDPLLACLASPYFLLLEADLVGFLAGFALALAIAMPPSFSYAPGSSAKV
jgi:hypothetical protein